LGKSVVIILRHEHIRMGDLSKSMYVTPEPIEARSQGKIIEPY